MIWQAEGTPFDDLTRAIERFDVLFTAAEQQVMDAVAAELGQVTTAAAPPPSEEIPEPVPVEPGEAAVSLDTLAMIATLWAGVVAAELMPALTVEYLAGAFDLANWAMPALTDRLARESSQDKILPTIPEPAELLDNITAEDYLANARNRMVRFSDVLWDVARAQLLAGFMEGDGIEELRDRLRSVPGITAGRAATVARTEVVSASNAGSITMVRTLGFEGFKIWQATEDERTRETHSDGPIGADGQRVALGEMFIVGGFPLDYPGDPTGPPGEIINCRCSPRYELTDDDESLTAGGSMAGEWIGVLALEGVPTGDVPRRMFMPGVLSSAELPLPLLWQHRSDDGHDGSVIVGDIRDVSRMGELIPGKGTFDLGGPDGVEAHRMVREGYLRGISIDADNFEPSDVEYVYGPGPIDPAGTDGPTVVMTIFHAGRLRGATLCAIPAFAEARISLMSDTTDALAESEVQMIASAAPVAEVELLPALTAAAYVLTIPDVPPSEWFAEPTDVDIKGALTVTDEGRVYGYLAPAGVDHRSFAKSVRVPMGNVDYSLFMGRETIVAGGGRVVTGALTMDCGHASTGHRDPSAALDHYDNACSIVATVRIGENERGVWVAGSLVPGVDPNQIVRMMACQLSGDWRPHRQRNGWREFAGALLVPVPGFAMTRTEASALVADGEAREVEMVPAGGRMRFAEGELVASAVPVEFVHTVKDCGCETPPTPKPKPSFSYAVQALASQLGLDKKARLAAMRNMVNETRE